MASTMKISVIIPFHNAQKTLPLCLKAVSSQTKAPEEVILVDNNSQDTSLEIAKEFAGEVGNNWILLSEAKRGSYLARNIGAQQCSGEMLVFTDSDCVPDKNWLRDLTLAFDDPRIAAVAGNIRGYKAGNSIQTFHNLFTLRGLQNEKIFSEFSLTSGGFPTANLAIRKSVFDCLNGFDTSLKSGGDYDLCARIYKEGFSIKYVREALVYHIHRNDIRGTCEQAFRFGQSCAFLLSKHFKNIAIIELPKYHFVSQKWPIRLWFNLVSADKKFLALLLLSIGFRPLITILFIYLLFLYWDMQSRLVRNGLNAGFIEKWQLVFLLFVKSLAMSVGRIVGSLRHKVLCF